MDENKELEMNEEIVEEVTEEVTEAEECACCEGECKCEEEPCECCGEECECAEETCDCCSAECACVEVEEAPAKKMDKKTLGMIIGAAVLVVLIAVGFATKVLPWNKYNHMGYINITGRTLGDIAEENGIELKELKEQYGLPENMKASTKESAAYYMMPVKTVAAMYGMDFATMKEMLGFGDEITEDTPWGIAEGETTLEKYVGKDNFEDFKKEYGFGEEVTLETKWKEVRKTVDKASRKKYKEQEKEQKKQEKEAKKNEGKEAVPSDAEVPIDEAPVEEAPAETPAE